MEIRPCAGNSTAAGNLKSLGALRPCDFDSGYVRQASKCEGVLERVHRTYAQYHIVCFSCGSAEGYVAIREKITCCILNIYLVVDKSRVGYSRVML